MNINIFENQLSLKLPLFDATNRDYIQDIIKNTANLNRTELYILLKIVRNLDENTDAYTKETFIDLIEDLYIKEQNPPLHMADRGENVGIDIKLRANDNFTNSFIVARKADDKTALSSLTLAGTDATIQRVTLEDIDLPTGSFSKILILSEKGADDGAGGQEASGDVETVISKMYLFIDEEAEA